MLEKVPKSPTLAQSPPCHLNLSTECHLPWQWKLPIRMSRVSNYFRMLYHRLSIKYLLFSSPLKLFTRVECDAECYKEQCLKLFLPVALAFKPSQREDRILPEHQHLASPEQSKRCGWSQLSCYPAPKVLLVLLLLPFKMTKIWAPAEVFCCASWWHRQFNPSSWRIVFGVCRLRLGVPAKPPRQLPGLGRGWPLPTD